MSRLHRANRLGGSKQTLVTQTVLPRRLAAGDTQTHAVAESGSTGSRRRRWRRVWLGAAPTSIPALPASASLRRSAGRRCAPASQPPASTSTAGLNRSPTPDERQRRHLWRAVHGARLPRRLRRLANESGLSKLQADLRAGCKPQPSSDYQLSSAADAASTALSSA